MFIFRVFITLLILYPLHVLLPSYVQDLIIFFSPVYSVILIVVFLNLVLFKKRNMSIRNVTSNLKTQGIESIRYYSYLSFSNLKNNVMPQIHHHCMIKLPAYFKVNYAVSPAFNDYGKIPDIFLSDPFISFKEDTLVFFSPLTNSITLAKPM